MRMAEYLLACTVHTLQTGSKWVGWGAGWLAGWFGCGGGGI